jgi:hypothetical protein
MLSFFIGQSIDAIQRMSSTPPTAMTAKDDETQDQHAQITAAAHRRAPGVVEPGVEQAHVALVGLEGGVEDVAGERHHADQPFDGDVDRHAREDAAAHAERAGFAHDVAGEQHADDVAQHRHQADERVQADAEARSRDRDRAVEEPG